MTIERWTLINLTFTDTATGVEMVGTTDVPCHLWLRATTNQPFIHKKAVLIRGLRIRDDVRFCFTVFDDTEQDEAGDTLVHTFLLEPWPICETRYFYFHGTIGGVPSPSTTAIFSYHRVSAPTTTIFYSDAHPELTSFDGMAIQAGAAPLTWAGIRNAAGNLGADTQQVLTAWALRSHANVDRYTELWRTLFLFDTSIIPPGSPAISAVLTVRGDTKIDTMGINPDIAVFTTNPLFNNKVTASDFATFGTTRVTNVITFAAYNVHPALPTGINDFTFTALGLSAIIPGGITKLGLANNNYDRLNNPPTWAPSLRSSFGCFSVDKGGPYRPTLTVTY